MTPLILFSIAREDYLWTLIFACVAGLSDLIDGFIARRFNLISRVGRFLDPTADKVLVISVYVLFLIKGIIPMWFGLLVLCRDMALVLGFLGFRIFGYRIELNPSPTGKVSIIMQFLVGFIIIVEKAFNSNLYSFVLFYPVALICVVSFVGYVKYAFSYTSERLK
jgi:cardiolipin synthase